MLNNYNSVVTVTHEYGRDYVVETSKTVLLRCVSFLLNKSTPIYYIDTDVIFIPSNKREIFNELVETFHNTCSDMIDTDISFPYIDENEKSMTGFIFGRKKMIMAKKEHMYVKNVDTIDDDVILNVNKNFFGAKYKDIFPEYVVWDYKYNARLDS